MFLRVGFYIALLINIVFKSPSCNDDIHDIKVIKYLFLFLKFICLPLLFIIPCSKMEDSREYFVEKMSTPI